jgi:hypothetical protein
MTTLRRATPDECAGFVAHAWLYSYASSDWALRNTPKDATHTRQCETCGEAQFKSKSLPSGAMVASVGQQYLEGHRALISKLIRSCNVTVAEAEDGLLDGFVCRDEEQPLLHYVYVRESARANGVAKMLVDDLASRPTTVTHKGRGIKKARLPRSWRFSEYPLMGIFVVLAALVGCGGSVEGQPKPQEPACYCAAGAAECCVVDDGGQACYLCPEGANN